jgi:PAS domain-containing protein
MTQARDALAHIEAHPDQWDQDTWICGTTACLAGWIVLRNGWTPLDSQEDPDWMDVQDVSLVVDPDGGIDQCPAAASRILGILPEEGDCLWESTNTLTDLHRLVGRLEADQAVYETPNLRPVSYEHSWVDRDGRVQVAAHRRTTYERLGGCTRRLDHDTRADALAHAQLAAAGRALEQRKSARMTWLAGVAS